MAYTVKLGPDTVGFNENGNKLKLRDSSFKNVFENSMALIKINEVPVQSEKIVSSESNVEVSKAQTPSINSKRVIKDALGLVGNVVSMSSDGRKPVKIKPAVAEAVARVGQRSLAVVSKGIENEKNLELIQEVPKTEVTEKPKVSAEVVEPFKNRAGDFSRDMDEFEESIAVDDKKGASTVQNDDLPEEPTISIPVEEIKKANEKTTSKVDDTVISNEDVLDTPVVKSSKVEAKSVNLDDVREMQEKLDEVGKATIEVRQKVVETKNQIDDVIKSTESEKKDLEKLNKDQEAARQKSEMLKQKTCDFLQQQMEVLERKKTTYFEQLSDYEVTLEQAREEKKKVETEKEKQEKEYKRTQEDYEAWAELHKAITNKAAEFDSQLGQDEVSKVVSFRDLVTEMNMNTDTKDMVVDDTVSVKRL